jgi:large subunit ribosomal protein L21
MTFAVIKTGGKQYKVSEGTKLNVEKLETVRDSVVFDEVLLVSSGDKTLVGQPILKGAKVAAKVLKHDKGEKKMVFKYKNKTRQRKKKGHRQPYTQVEITKITA